MNASKQSTAPPASSRRLHIKGLHQLRLGVIEGSSFFARVVYRRVKPLFLALLQLGLFSLLFPIAWLLLIVTLLADLIATPLVMLKRSARARAFESPRTRNASIITVSFNGQHFLELLIPSLKKTVQECGGQHEIIIVDNGSSDGTVEWLKRAHPDVRCVALSENRFFVRGNMEGVKVAQNDILVFVNNDMEVNETFLRDLLDGFTDADIFAVSAQVFFKEPTRRREETGKTRVRWKRGQFLLSHDMVNAYDTERKYTPVFWAGGGSAAFDHQKFLAIGGFDTLYDPFYVEDTGLSYQAWKRGMRVLFTPSSFVLHEHRGTSRKLFGDRYIDQIIRRNQHLFTWRNVTDLKMVVSHFLFLPILLLKGARRHDFRFELEAFWKALARFPKAILLRELDRPLYRFSDRQVLALSSSYVSYDAHYGRPSWTTALQTRKTLRILFLLARLPKRNTDGSWILFNLITRLAERHRITLLSFIDRSDEEAHAEELRPHCEKVDVLLRRQNHGAPNLHGLIPRRLAIDYTDPRMHAKIDEYVHGGNFDVIQCEYVEMAHMLPDLSRFPSIFTHHEVMSLAADRAMRCAANVKEWVGPAHDRMLYLAYERKICRRFRKVVTLSSVDGDYLQSYYPTLDVVTIPSGVNAEFFAPDLAARANEKPHIVFVGYYLHPPNLDAAMFLAREIFPIVKATVPEARCYLVGKEPTEEVLELARADSHVIVTGFVPDLRPILRDAAVVAIPIRKGAGLRGKFLEAWAMAKPVVATSVAAEGFEARDGVHYLQADRAEGFAERLIELLKDRGRRAQLGDAGRRLVMERYSDAAMAAAYERLYFEMIERRS